MDKFDKTINDGKAVEEMTKTKGWQIYSEWLSAQRGEAHQQVLLVDGNKIWRGRMNAFDDALGQAEIFIKDGEEARDAKKEEKGYGQDAGNVSDDSGNSLEDNG